MKRTYLTAFLAVFFVVTSVVSGMAANNSEEHHAGGAQGAVIPQDMRMGQGGPGNMMCPENMGQMMGSGHMGRMMGNDHMGQMMGSGHMKKMMGGAHMGKMMGGQMMQSGFYLDRIEELGLSADQVNQLKTIHVNSRTDNIRNSAEAKIARLELNDLLSNQDWNLKDAESLVRKLEKIKGDIQVRHLQAVSDARKVLTAEQLKQVNNAESNDALEGLFE